MVIPNQPVIEITSPSSAFLFSSNLLTIYFWFSKYDPLPFYVGAGYPDHILNKHKLEGGGYSLETYYREVVGDDFQASTLPGQYPTIYTYCLLHHIISTIHQANQPNQLYGAMCNIIPDLPGHYEYNAITPYSPPESSSEAAQWRLYYQEQFRKKVEKRFMNNRYQRKIKQRLQPPKETNGEQ